MRARHRCCRSLAAALFLASLSLGLSLVGEEVSVFAAIVSTSSSTLCVDCEILCSRVTKAMFDLALIDRVSRDVNGR